MEKLRMRSSHEESLGRLERALSRLTSFHKGNEPYEAMGRDEDSVNDNENFKGPLGLNLLHTVPEPLIDFIFVHGLGGGSRKTWSKTSDPYHYWPKEWLSRDPEFGYVRVHSFGYRADWTERNESFLNIHDFSLSLLGEIQCNPDIRRSNTRIVLIAHSMGGIVLKKAYILAREDPTLKTLADRIHTLYFLATPHRGSDLAKTLLNILKVSFGQKTFVAELKRNSDSIQSVNDSFRYFADQLQLWSFYETIPYNLVVADAIIVDKSSATLGYPKERCSLLNANHRDVCKFERPTDPNFKTLRNAFITTVDSILSEASQAVSERTKVQYSRLIELTGISEPPMDDFFSSEELRVPGTCEWLSSRDAYITWQSTWSVGRPIFWLTGDAGSGKSILSSYVINDLETNKFTCSYYYFRHGSPSKSSITGCLLSLAFQMAHANETILKRLIQQLDNVRTCEHLDERSLWHQLFMGSIFKEPNPTPHFWVIDALDECHKFPVLISLLSKAPPYLRIFLTSRNSLEVQQCLMSLTSHVEHYGLKAQDTLTDLGFYIDSRIHRFPAGNDESQRNLRTKIIEKAGGSFLWVSLVIKELESVYSEESAEELFDQVPADMNELYTRMLQNIPQKGKKLARSIFAWTLLAMRPLTLHELREIIKLDTNETVHNLGKVIMDICGQLIGVGQNSQVRCIHQTAKMFLLQQEQFPALIINKSQTHSRIAEICLRFLNTCFNKGARPHQWKAKTPATLAAAGTDFTEYAAVYFSDHLLRCASEDSEVWHLLAEFLEKNAFTWIEYLARSGSLQHITHTAKNLKSYLTRRLKYLQPFSTEKENLETWIQDLVRLNGKFRKYLAVCPSAIFNLVPALCPMESMVSKIYASRPRGIIVKGLKETTWDECLARIDFPGVLTSAVAYGGRYLAVAVSDGTISLYHRYSMETKVTLSHKERAKLLCFSSDDVYLASSGLHKVRVWNLHTHLEMWSFDVQHQPLTLLFTDDDTSLISATQGNYTIAWDLQQESGEEEIRTWTRNFQETTGQHIPSQPPAKALLSEDCSTLAVSYRGAPIYLFDMKTESFIGYCNRLSEEVRGSLGRQYVVDALTFNPSPEINILVASYGDGELVVYDLWTTELRHRTPDVFAHSLACSPDGRTLVTGGSRGTIHIFEFSGAEGTNLSLIYQINAFEDGIRGITFSKDSLQFTDIRASQCRIWEPAVLVRNDFDAGSQSELSQAITLRPKLVGMLEGPTEAEITATCLHPSGDYFFCGKKDGSVTYFEARAAIQREVLYRHAINTGINCIAYSENSGILVTADESSRIIVSAVKTTSAGCYFVGPVSEIRVDGSVLALLLNNSGTKVLIQGRHSAQVWTIHGARTSIPILVHESEGSWNIINHPLQQDIFLSISYNDTHVYSWGCDPKEDGTQESGLHENNQVVQNLNLRLTTDLSLGNTDQLIALLVKGNAMYPPMPDSKLMIWRAASISQKKDWPTEITLPSFEELSANIRQILGLRGSLLLFVDNDFWVWSLDVELWNAAKQGMQRHFFLLSEWKGSNGDFLIEYVPSRRDFIIVNKHDVLVVRRGLDVTTSSQ